MNHQGSKTPRDREGAALRTRIPSIKPVPAELDLAAKKIVDAAYAVHSSLGPGLLENVYELCLAHELSKRDVAFERQVVLPIRYDGIKLDAGFRVDFLVEHAVVVELKAVDALLPVHLGQVLTYLKLSEHRLGLLINFNVALIKDGIRRIAL
jgi:GxxExxY protein